STVRGQKPPVFSGSLSSNAVKLTVTPAPPLPRRWGQELAGDLDTLQLVIFPPRPSAATPRLYLSVPPFPVPPVREARVVRLLPGQAEAVLGRLARLGFFDRAVHIPPDTKEADDALFRGVAVSTEKLGWLVEGRWTVGTELLLRGLLGELGD